MKKNFALKALAVFITAALLIGLLPAGILTASAAEPITVANIRVAVPEAGEHPDFAPVSDDEEKYTATVNDWYLYDDGYPSLNGESVFELGKMYALRVYFEAKEGYEFTNETEFRINGFSTACFGSNEAREILFDAIATEFDISDPIELKRVLNRNMPVKAINIVSNMTIYDDCTIMYDSEHIDNYHDTVLTIKKGVVVTVGKGGLLGSFWPSFEGDWESPLQPNGKIINNGGIIVKNGGGVIADFDTNNGEVIVENGGECVCANTNNGAVYVESGGNYRTSQGREVRNHGAINVAENGTMMSRFGSTIINEEDGVINLDGVFMCGCVGFEEDVMWFQNHGTVNGQGSAILYEADRDVAPVSDMDALIEEMMAQLGQETRFDDWSDVNIYKMYDIRTFEELVEALPEERTVAGEKVEGNMDVIVQFTEDIVIPEGKTVAAMALVIITEEISLTVESGALLECGIQNGGFIEVMPGGSLYTTMGGNIANYSEIIVHEGAQIASQMGGEIINAEGATLTLDGELFCGCIGFDGNEGFWFQNDGTVNGCGSVYLYEADAEVAHVTDMDALIEGVMVQLGQETRFENWDDISIYKIVIAKSYEELAAAFPGNRVVAGENVEGDMDVKAAIAEDITIPEGAEIDTMGSIGIPEGVTVTVSSGAVLKCGLENEGNVNVLSGGALYTTMGGDINNYGIITVYEGAEMKSHMSGRVRNMEGGVLILNGEFTCGCIGIDGNDICWFENSGTVNGTGTIYLNELDHERLTISDMNALVAAVKAAIADSGEPQPEVRVKRDRIAGDINGDGAVNNKDLTRLFQYLSDWDVEVNEAALDVNGDGSVNNKDLTRLFQYLSDWDVEIF
ncbi:MAG: hypothetical protein J5662_01525 [Clostridia bacterium]|nr:hypothetical protein [Clostridia bacterium]